jgi:hypothetical protein
MENYRSLHLFALAIITLSVLTLAGCGGAPGTKAPVEALPQIPEKHRAQFEGGFTLDYQVERKISTLNGKSCYAFITGTLSNQSAQTLSRRSVIDFEVMQRGQQLFRDITNPVSDIPPGGSAVLNLVTSPLHKEGCPAYETISVSLRKVLLN